MIFFAPMGKNLAKDGSSKIDRVFMGFVEWEKPIVTPDKVLQSVPLALNL
jgi:hypothetical protein